jgi:hypothetical protein
MLLASATLELLDGSSYSGFVTPDFEGDLGNQQPHIFVGDQWFGFWSGLFGAQIEQREGFYAALGKKADAIFTLRFSVDARIATGHCNGQVHGFYRSVRGKEPEIEL